MHTKAVLFDLDGTLIDTSPDLINACVYTLKKYHVKNIDIHKIKSVLTSGMRAMMLSCMNEKEQYNLDVQGEMRETFADYYINHINVASQPFAGIETLLSYLLAHNIKIGVITNKYEQMAQKLLKSYSFYQDLTLIIGGDTLPKAKPDPLPLIVATEKLKLQPNEIIYLGDHSNDILCANRAGCISALASWGYGDLECNFDQVNINLRLSQPTDLTKYL